MIAFVVKWTIKKGCEKKAIKGLKELAKDVEEEEETLVYLVNTPDPIRFKCSKGDEHESLPTPSRQEVIFIEQYADEEAFCKHVNGRAFKKFLREYGDLFLSSNGQPYVGIEFLRRQGGFIRKEAVTK
jgi:quinol monooxygenase YgiN